MGLKNIVRRWLLDDRNSVSGVSTICTSDTNLMEENTTNMLIFPAIGGKIVEFRRYDHRKDERYLARYIIKDDDDFGSRLSNIITLENLKN